MKNFVLFIIVVVSVVTLSGCSTLIQQISKNDAADNGYIKLEDEYVKIVYEKVDDVIKKSGNTIDARKLLSFRKEEDYQFRQNNIDTHADKYFVAETISKALWLIELDANVKVVQTKLMLVPRSQSITILKKKLYEIGHDEFFRVVIGSNGQIAHFSSCINNDNCISFEAESIKLNEGQIKM